MTDTYTPTQHSSVVGGSSAARVMSCPGSVRLLQSLNLPDNESPYAAEGTALHNAVEHCLYEGLSSDEETLIDELLGKEFYGHKLTAGQVRTVADAMRVFDDLYSRLEIEDGEVLTYAVETQAQFPGIPDAFGTADILMVTPVRSIVLDWKFGAGVPVSAERNKQLMFYARAAAHSAPAYFWPAGMNADSPGAVNRLVELIVVQPRIGDGEPSIWQTTFGDLCAYEGALVAAVSTIDDKDVKFSRGDYCRWCGAAPKCPVHERTMSAVQDMFTNLDAPADRKVSVQRTDPPTVDHPAADKAFTVTPDLLADWLDKADALDTWVSSVRALAHDMAEHGVTPTGYKLVRKYGNLDYTHDDPKKVDKMLANKGLKVAERQKRVPVTATQANAALKRIGKPPLSDKLARRPVRGTKLVPIDAPGEAIPGSLAPKAIDEGVSKAFE